MHFLELQPTYENLLRTFENDIIGTNKDIVSFADMLNYIDSCCSIAIEARWGEGKTFFIKKVKMILDSYNEFIDNKISDSDKLKIKEKCDKLRDEEQTIYIPQVSIYYDAWKNDNDEDPIFSLIFSIITDVANDYKLKQETDIFKKAASVLEFFTKRNYTKILEGFKSEDLLSNLKDSKEIEEQINEFLNSLLTERGDRLVVFIDELDRCRPDYAVKLLERIKHYFINDRITFVFAINSLELQHTIKKFYGENFDGSRYLDRFFDFRVALPPINYDYYYLSIGHDKNSSLYNECCSLVISNNNFAMREITKYITTTRIATKKYKAKNAYFFPNESRGFALCVNIFVPIMIGLKIKNFKEYEDFICGKDFSPVKEIVNSLLSAKKLNSNRFFDLLEENETYSEDVEGKKIVSVEDKMRQVYELVFLKDFEEKSIGNYSFCNSFKNELIRIAGLTSQHADFSI